MRAAAAHITMLKLAVTREVRKLSQGRLVYRLSVCTVATLANKALAYSSTYTYRAPHEACELRRDHVHFHLTRARVTRNNRQHSGGAGARVHRRRGVVKLDSGHHLVSRLGARIAAQLSTAAARAGHRQGRHCCTCSMH